MGILITGASGNVGKYVAQELIKLGEDVVVAGTDPMKLNKIFGDEVKAVELDFTNHETFDAALEDIDRMFLMRPPHLGNPEDLYPFIDAADIGLAIATVLHDPGKHRNSAYTITGADALDYFEVAETISKLTGRKITYAKPGYLKYRNHYIKNRGLDKGYVNVTVALYFMTRMGTAEAVTDEFLKLTGKKPKTFEEFVRENIKEFKR
ncbi:MAG: NAD(P)H-binding protein [Bacillota bacterium]|nr:NAD(P)H-binding protein [Bacillota bacterium]